MRKDNKPWKKQGYKDGGRTGKQFGGPLARPGIAPVRPLGFKGGKRVGKQFGGALAAGVRPLARGLGYKHGSKKPAKKA